MSSDAVNPIHYCHPPVIVIDPSTSLEKVISQLKVSLKKSNDDVIDQDIILLWGSVKKVITGSDILGRLLRGIIGNNAFP